MNRITIEFARGLLVIMTPDWVHFASPFGAGSLTLNQFIQLAKAEIKRRAK